MLERCENSRRLRKLEHSYLLRCTWWAFLRAELLPRPATPARQETGNGVQMVSPMLCASSSIFFFLRAILLRVSQAHLHHNKDEDHCHATSWSTDLCGLSQGTCNCSFCWCSISSSSGVLLAILACLFSPAMQAIIATAEILFNLEWNSMWHDEKLSRKANKKLYLCFVSNKCLRLPALSEDNEKP